MRLTQQATTTTTQTVELKARQRKELTATLEAIEEVRNNLDVLKAEESRLKDIAEAIRESTGQNELEYEGSKITRVYGTTTYDDWEMAIDNGWISPSQREQMRKTKPKKPYTLINTPGRKGRNKGDD